MATIGATATGPAATRLGTAKAVALLVPLALLGGAYGSQYLGGLSPCEMCYWQRYAHFAGLAFALAALLAGRAARPLVLLAALGIMASGLIGAYHAGVEAGIFEGVTQCSTVAVAGSAEDVLRQIMAAPVVRCDQVQWEFLAISMAGWNAILSLSASLVILWLILKPTRIRA